MILLRLASFFLKKKTQHSLINIGSGYEDTVKGYINFISTIVGCKSNIVFNKNKNEDGTLRKLLDCSLAKKYGWLPKFNFLNAFDITYKDFLKNRAKYLKM
jgi:GDP-L-fucose synthase